MVFKVCPFFLFSVLHHLQSGNGVTSTEDEEIHEIQEDDRELFSDQLASIGTLGRVAADHCIPLLTRYPCRNLSQDRRHNLPTPLFRRLPFSTVRTTSRCPWLDL